MNTSPRPPSELDWLAIALRPEIVRRSLRVAAVVGTILVGVNYTDRWLTGTLSAFDWVKMGATYLVPYGVSTFTAVQMSRGSIGGNRR